MEEFENEVNRRYQERIDEMIQIENEKIKEKHKSTWLHQESIKGENFIKAQ